MAGKKIGELTPLGRNLISTDELELSLTGSAGSRKITGSELTAGLQPTLVSGTNIKTVNSTSILGSGDIAVQPTLVSGTNIKTVNGSSILGSGNLVISGGVTSVTGTYPISSSGGATPAISIATASAGSSGALSSTDWSTFNSKQTALVSGTNIKTVNSNTLLGSGDVAVQPTLVSGTNIKTVNGQSLLGSGNISITQARNRYQGVRNPYAVSNPQVYLGAPIIEGNIVNVSSLVIFNASSGTQYLRLYASQSSSSIVGAILLGYFSTTGVQYFSSVFTRQFHTFFVGGESEGEPYGNYYIRTISPYVSALTDIGTQTSNYGDIMVGDINGITHPHLILSATQYDIQNWICEWS